MSSRPSGVWQFPGAMEKAHILCDGDSGEPCGEDGASPGVAFAESDVAESSAGESAVHPADAGEKGVDIHSARPSAASAAVSIDPCSLSCHAVSATNSAS